MKLLLVLSMHLDSFTIKKNKFTKLPMLTVGDSVFRDLIFRLCSLKIAPTLIPNE